MNEEQQRKTLLTDPPPIPMGKSDAEELVPAARDESEGVQRESRTIADPASITQAMSMKEIPYFFLP